MAKCDCCGEAVSDYGNNFFSHRALRVEEKDLQDLCDATYDGITLCIACEYEYSDYMREASLKWLREMKVVKEEGGNNA